MAVSGQWSHWSVFESLVGIHRIQRVPPTEKNGRRHTSTVVVAILEDSQKRKIELNWEDVKIITYRDSGPGGQHRNKTDSAVRMTHLPTGTTVTATENRSQYINRQNAELRLIAKLSESAETAFSAGRNNTRSSSFEGERGWTWCGWRDEVVNSQGKRYSMKKALKGNFGKLL